ncbi:GNAT family N-acetyltransferase [Bradyrhizobium ivorense]|uniref:GNAT family N-acetyltransferase n=1 Tax=Bradyrhizobium ivorense TaxID=2511166 RepID=UPI001FCEA1C0|nr:GNAT family N-acetyltransferase [Bradyrhizobium ivorense]
MVETPPTARVFAAIGSREKHLSAKVYHPRFASKSAPPFLTFYSISRCLSARVQRLPAFCPAVGVDEFIDVLRQSGLDDADRIGRIIANADLVVTARQAGKLVGVSRADRFLLLLLLSDLAVDRAYQGHGIGKRLIEETRRHAG